MPCSCSRCTNRSRVRAEVMPMPLRRGPSIKLLNLEPAPKIVERRMARQVDLQGCNRSVPLGHRMKVRARSGILPRAGIAHPIYLPSPRIFRSDNGLGAVPVPQPGHLDAPQLPVRQVWNIDVENDRPLLRTLQWMPRDTLKELRRHACRAGEIARAVRRQAK